MKSNYTILALDTSFQNCSIALLHKNILYHFEELCIKNHEKRILKIIIKIIKYSKINFQEINFIACNTGPGHFTGIRISLTIANALSIGLKIPILNFSIFQILSEKIWYKYSIRKTLIKLKISKNYFFVGKYFKNIQNKWIGVYEKYQSVSVKNFYFINTTFSGIWAISGNIKITQIKNKKKLKFFYTKISQIYAKDIIFYMLLKFKKYIKFKNIKKF
ncbi:tRNA (adenosine(37)-N6)-threonylcarbamoyltransferase complex dimerization subunit type 1 TsaB [Buchnera aphidicola]|uniref:tRNA (adenosine(37)-N6)-threonylcarbamoyltransferase complex dimerization subunit type 1 TsaB n=1 Tax=Buchnera aphidicola TaxID=9 RepID=UPI0031B6FC4A